MARFTDEELGVLSEALDGLDPVELPADEVEQLAFLLFGLDA